MLFDCRCKKCKKLLGKMNFVGYIEIKCRCGFMNKIGFKEIKVYDGVNEQVVQYSER